MVRYSQAACGECPCKSNLIQILQWESSIFNYGIRRGTGKASEAKFFNMFILWGFACAYCKLGTRRKQN